MTFLSCTAALGDRRLQLLKPSANRFMSRDEGGYTRVAECSPFCVSFTSHFHPWLPVQPPKPFFELTLPVTWAGEITPATDICTAS